MKKAKTIKAKTPNLPKLLPPDFVDKLLEYKSLHAATKAATAKKYEAEQAERDTYAREVAFSRKVVEIWRKHRPIYTFTETFRLPDGQIARIENGMIWFEAPTNLL